MEHAGKMFTKMQADLELAKAQLKANAAEASLTAEYSPGASSSSTRPKRYQSQSVGGGRRNKGRQPLPPFMAEEKRPNEKEASASSSNA